jgi:hypothetical protein
MADAHRLLRRPDAFAHDVDDGQVEVAVGQDQPVVEVATGGRAGVGRHVVHPELRSLRQHRRRLDRLLQLMDDLALDGLQLGQAFHRAQVVEGDAEMVGQGGGRRLVDRAEHVGLGVHEQEGAVGRALGTENRNREAAGLGRQLETLQEPPVPAVLSQLGGSQDVTLAGLGPDEAGQRRPGEPVDLSDRRPRGRHHVLPLAESDEGGEGRLGEGARLLGDPVELVGDLARAVDGPSRSSQHLHVGAHQRRG